MSCIGEILKKARGDKTLGQIATLSKMGKGYLSKVERGERTPKPDMLKRLSSAYNIPYKDLMIASGYWEDTPYVHEMADILQHGGIPMDPAPLLQKKEAVPTLDEAERLYVQALLESKKLSKDKQMTDEEISRMESAIRMGLRIIRDTND